MKTILQLRTEHGLTQQQLANRLGCTPGAVYNWERGKSEPKASQLRTMAAVFGVSMDDIAFEGDGTKTAWLNQSDRTG